jgi:arylformamidase
MARPEAAGDALVELGGRRFRVGLATAHSIAITQRFDGAQPRWFAAPPARAAALRAGSFNGRVARGASCNCSSYSLTPHCDGTHTEGAGHLTREALDVLDVVPPGLIPALLLSIAPVAAETAPGEDSDPAPQAGDTLLTAAAIVAAWPAALPCAPAALVLRTLPNAEEKCRRDYRRQRAAYLTRQAAQLLVERGIRHLVLDLPSADRDEDGGALTAHRTFFGLPPGTTALASAARADCTITEFAYVPDAIADGPWALQIQVPALAGDALPSRPLLHAMAPA